MREPIAERCKPEIIFKVLLLLMIQNRTINKSRTNTVKLIQKCSYLKIKFMNLSLTNITSPGFLKNLGI